MKDRTILITGGTGYLGSNVLGSLLKEEYTVVLLKRRNSSLNRIAEYTRSIKIYNIEDIAYDEVLKHNEINTVIHMATSYGRKGETLSDITNANIDFPTGLLNASLKTGVKCFINTDTSLPAEVNHYAFTKRVFKAYLESKKNEIDIINVVPEYFYGPGDDNWKLVTMIIQKLMQIVPVIEFTDGLQERDFIYIQDVVNAYRVILQNSNKLKGFHEFSVSSGKIISIRTMAQLCKEICKNEITQLAFGAIPTRSNDVLYSSGDNTPLQKLGWYPQTDLESGISYIKDSYKIFNQSLNL